MTIIKYLFLVGAISIGCHAEPGNHNIATDTIHIICTRKDQLLSSQKANSNAISEEAIQRAIISKGDSSFHVYSDIRADYRIVGYESADTNSRKMIVFSVFTNDVEGNPNRCPFGSYYHSPSDLVIKYNGDKGSFVQTRIMNTSGKSTTVYFEKKWVEFED